MELIEKLNKELEHHGIKIDVEQIRNEYRVVFLKNNWQSLGACYGDTPEQALSNLISFYFEEVAELRETIRKQGATNNVKSV